MLRKRHNNGVLDKGGIKKSAGQDDHACSDEHGDALYHAYSDAYDYGSSRRIWQTFRTVLVEHLDVQLGFTIFFGCFLLDILLV